MVKHGEVCVECKEKTISYGIGLCAECYESLFVGLEPKTSEEDEDIVLAHDVAQVKDSGSNGEMYIKFQNGSVIHVPNSNGITLRAPRAYKVDFDKMDSYEEVALLISAILSETVFYDNYRHFDKIKHLLKEIE